MPQTKANPLKNIFNRPPLRNRHDEESLFKWKKPVYTKDGLAILNRLAKRAYRKPKQQDEQRFGGGCGGGYAFEFPPRNQRVAFIMSYSNDMASHNKFIDTYMPQKEKENVVEKPVLFGMDEDEYGKYKAPLNFKCRISPESQKADLEELTKSFIKRLEAQTGYSLLWRGAIHSDTAHRHAHVVINGKDRNGKDVWFNKETIILMRAMCMNAATTMLGERTKEEVELAKKRELAANRWTRLDERLDNFPGGVVSRTGLPPELEIRLVHLSTIKLARLNRETGRYELSGNWKEILQASSRHNTFFEEYMKDGDPLEMYAGGGVKGVVERVITRDKDEAYNDALVIKTEGKRIYVPVWQLHKENLLGKNVSIKDSGKNGEGKISRNVRDRDISVRG